MPSNTLHRKCPRCGRKRTFTVPPNHQFPDGLHWEIREGVWVCAWCIAREIPDGEDKLRQELSYLRECRKKRKKAWNDQLKQLG